MDIGMPHNFLYIKNIRNSYVSAIYEISAAPNGLFRGYFGENGLKSQGHCKRSEAISPLDFLAGKLASAGFMTM